VRVFVAMDVSSHRHISLCSLEKRASPGIDVLVGVICRWTPVVGMPFGIQPGPGLLPGQRRLTEKIEHRPRMSANERRQLPPLLSSQSVAIGQRTEPWTVLGRVAAFAATGYLPPFRSAGSYRAWLAERDTPVAVSTAI
jgi:hypothetical protein